jgi:hypothetical protein
MLGMDLAIFSGLRFVYGNAAPAANVSDLRLDSKAESLVTEIQAAGLRAGRLWVLRVLRFSKGDSTRGGP